ncbi:hypothetical protein EMGBS10_01730, partial [Opitutia bacterium]
MPRWFLTPLLALSVAFAAAAEDGKLLYEQNCAACHLPDQMVVGPSLIEISKLYAKKPKEFVEWAIKPQKKRNNVIEMPSMAHLGEEKLLAIREHIADGVRRPQGEAGDHQGPAGPPRPPPGDPAHVPAQCRPGRHRGRPAGDLNFCFDAGDCR